jgi:hypothetical protein
MFCPSEREREAESANQELNFVLSSAAKPHILLKEDILDDGRSGPLSSSIRTLSLLCGCHSLAWCRTKLLCGLDRLGDFDYFYILIKRNNIKKDTRSVLLLRKPLSIRTSHRTYQLRPTASKTRSSMRQFLRNLSWHYQLMKLSRRQRLNLAETKRCYICQI